MKKTNRGTEKRKIPLEQRGTSIQGQALYVRPAELTAPTLECRGCFASLRSDKGLHPLRHRRRKVR